MGQRKYSKEFLIQTIKNFNNKFGTIPKHKDCNTKGLMRVNVYSRYFGSWSKALIASNINYKPPVKNKPIKTKCLQCGKKTMFVLSQLKSKTRKTKNIFCSRSCSTTFNNRNKQYGTRRSKLEIEIEKRLLKDYTSIQIEFNSKTAINSELDIYFPELKFAIELNGIVHYEPIYGKNKFNKIINNDRQKLITCYKKGIELAIVDVSQCKYLTEKSISKYYQYVKELLNNVIPRLESN